MKKVLPLLPALLVSFSLYAQTQVNWDWTITGSSSAANSARGICADRSGANAYVYGNFQDTLVLGADTLLPFTTNYNMYIVKYDNQGSMLWKTSIGCNQNLSIAEITSDVNGDLLVMGTFRDSLVFSDDTLIGTPGDNVYVMKYSSAGARLWMQFLDNAPAFMDNMALNTDTARNVYITGIFYNSYTIDTVGVNNVPEGMFLVKLNPSGSALWGKGFSLQAAGMPYGPAGLWADAAGNTYVTGTIGVSADFGNGVMLATSMGLDNGYLAKFDASGVCLWGQLFDGFNQAACVRGDDQGNIYCSGWFNSMLPNTIDTIAINGESSFGDFYIAKFNASGNVQWADAYGSNGIDLAMKLATDASGKLYALGVYGDTLVMGNDTVFADPNPSAFNLNTFLAEIESNGNVLSLSRIGLAGAIDVTDAGDVFFAGTDSTNSAKQSQSSQANIATSFIAKKEPAVVTSVGSVANTNGTMSVYPNPSEGMISLMIISPVSQDAMINVFGADGRVVLCKAVTLVAGRNEQPADLSKLSKGMYHVQVLSGVSVLNTRVIIQ